MTFFLSNDIIYRLKQRRCGEIGRSCECRPADEMHEHNEVKKQGVLRSAPSKQDDYVFEGKDFPKNQILYCENLIHADVAKLANAQVSEACGAILVGSSPIVCTRKEVTFVYQKLLLFLSKPQAWHIITRQRVYHRRRRISSARGFINCSLMRCNASH